jgi:hypothetical protein
MIKKTTPIKHCCDLMDLFLEDIRVPIMYYPISREYSMLMLEDGKKIGRMNAVQGIDHCPWCGKKLPASLRDKWFEVLEKEYNLDDPNSKEQEKLVPQEFKTDEWWVKRGL